LDFIHRQVFFKQPVNTTFLELDLLQSSGPLFQSLSNEPHTVLALASHMGTGRDPVSETLRALIALKYLTVREGRKLKNPNEFTLNKMKSIASTKLYKCRDTQL
jgi:hypothetical protein